MAQENGVLMELIYGARNGVLMELIYGARKLKKRCVDGADLWRTKVEETVC